MEVSFSKKKKLSIRKTLKILQIYVFFYKSIYILSFEKKICFKLPIITIIFGFRGRPNV